MYYFSTVSNESAAAIKQALNGWCEVGVDTNPTESFREASRIIVPCAEKISFSEAAKVLAVIIETTGDDAWIHQPYQAPGGSWVAAYPMHKPLNGKDTGRNLSDFYALPEDSKEHEGALMFVRDQLRLTVAGVDMDFRVGERRPLTEEQDRTREIFRDEFRGNRKDAPRGLFARRDDLTVYLGHDRMQEVREGTRKVDVLFPSKHSVHKLLKKFKGSIGDAQKALTDALGQDERTSVRTYACETLADSYWLLYPARKQAAILVDDDVLSKALQAAMSSTE